MRFYQSSWQGAKTVTVRAAQDNDGIHGAATVTHTASLAGYSGTTKTLSVEEADDDAGITLTPNALTVTENGSATYTVRLGKAPTDDVTVALTAASGDSDITFAPASLTFTTGNYSTAQTITVSAALDADTTDGSKTITHTTTSGTDTSYDNLTATLTATEDDITGTINISTISIAVTEGSTATYTVSLSQQPTASVTVALTSIGDSDITFAPASLTFTGNNYSTAQTVTVSAAEDNDVLPGALTITHTASSTDLGFNGVTAKISATEDENDKGIVIRDASLAFVNAITVNEGSFQHIFVSPSVDPTGNVTVAVTLTASTGDSDITYNPSSVSFTSTGSKVVQVFAAEDNDNDNGTKTITFTATSQDTGYSGKTATLKVTENDNEPQLSVSVTATTATMTLSNHTGNWYYKKGSGGSVTCEGPVTGTSKTVTGLTKNTSYPFSAFSDSACATQLDTVTVTTANPSLAASNVANTTATITLSGWDASKDGNWYHRNSNSTSTCTGPVSSASVNLSSLTEGTPYTWRAYSGKSGSNCTGQLAETTFTTTGSAPNAQLAAPSPVSSVSASRASGSIEATWSAVGGATGYDVVYSTDNKASWTRAVTNGSASSYTLAGADDSLPYIIGVRAVNAGGESAWTNSNTVPAVPVSPPPKPPEVHPPASVGSVSAGRLNGDVVANWFAVDRATGYNIVYSTDGKASWKRAATNHGGNTYTLTGAQYGLSYIFGVQAVNSGGASGWTNSNTVPIVKPPGNIVSVSASRVNDTIEVQWSAADNATGYHVVYSTDHAASWTRAATNHSGTSYTLTGADGSLPYIIGIQATNAAGVSGWKNSNTVN